MTSVKLGVHLPVAGKDASPQAIAQVAEEAERIGLDSVWVWERLMRPTVPIPMGGPGGPVMDATERDCEFIARFAAQGARLHVAKMMRVGGFATAEQARLLCDVTKMGIVTITAGGGHREHALVDAAAWPTGEDG